MAKGGDCKSSIHQFDSGRLLINSPSLLVGDGEFFICIRLRGDTGMFCQVRGHGEIGGVRLVIVERPWER